MPKHGSNDRNFNYPYKHPSLPAEVRYLLPNKNIKKPHIPQEFKAIVYKCLLAIGFPGRDTVQ